ncbi:PITH domain-containing protein GA19395 [Lutzomyia longipalpis]|uniref:Putative thioredoxin-like protein n=1 Tax=Lutzomyia longipalpis TaxID=7200 RepID=A0A1B0CV67_LUTLO|nr:PITH domain-containing protein GA19395 [Lutzomyia longipalpis]XP_055680533.1 PITH domain-containing protein GA19395 [Lutzomyia longipalpis]
MSHSHCCNHGSSGGVDPNEIGINYSLYTKIDLDNVECLNESVENSGKLIFRSYEERFDTEKIVESDADPELLFNIPFTGNVKLKGIIVMGADDETHPNKLRLFKNRPKMTFDQTSVKADQEFQLAIDPNGSVEYNTKPVVFSSVHHLSLHFPGNFGDDSTKIHYIGLKGEFTEAHHHGVTICNYEVRPNVSDHKGSIFDNVNQEIR